MAMVKIKKPGLDLSELFAHDERKSPGATVRERKAAAGNRQPKSTDRRYKHGAGRSRQYNTNVTQALFDAVDDAMSRYDLTKAELTERALVMFLESLKKGNRHA